MDKFLRSLNAVFNTIVIATLGALVLLVFANVVLRYFFQSGITWTVEVSGLLFVWLVFLGAVMAMRDYGHLGVDLFVARLPRPAQKGMFVLINGMIVTLSVMFIDGLLGMMALNGWMTGSATRIPVNVMYAAGLMASVLLILIAMAQVVRFVFLNTEAPPWAAGPVRNPEEHVE